MSGRPDEACPLCGGSGMIPLSPNPPHPPAYKRCACVLRGDILSNVEKGMKGLSGASVVKDTPLKGYVSTNLWVTASDDNFRTHLRHVAVRQPPIWFFRVISDAELVTAWLSSIALKGMDILDADAYTVSTKHLTIPDLALPPELVIIRMGIKAARNEAAPEVMLEALNTRIHEGKPTWVWDQPIHKFTAGHLCWSGEIKSLLASWDHIEDLKEGVVQSSTFSPPLPERHKRVSSRGLGTGSKKTLREDG